MKSQKLLDCSIGGISLEIRAQSSLIEMMMPLRSKLADFPSPIPSDLLLNIIVPSEETLRPARAGEKTSIRKNLFQLIPVKASDIPPTKHLRKRLDSLSEFSLPDDFFTRLGKTGHRISLVSFDNGFLLTDMNKGDCYLLLDTPPQNQGPARKDHWSNKVNITVLNSIMALLSLCLSVQGGVLAHGVGVKREKEGFLFLAPSDGGKTTLSTHCSEGEVLADDGVIIRKNSDNYKLFATPFRQRPGGEIHRWKWSLEPIPLKAVFVLGKGEKTSISRIPRANLINILLGSFTHFFSWMDGRQAKLVFDFWYELSLKLPIAKLNWRPDVTFWPEVNSFINEVNRNDFKEG
ncbi:MAG: hypothetical protein JRC68_05920 [Deltaproteobacteria bacterium]|nr:hypothetical protein [Deltaproteobacteria bacterium]